jgi:hypothetical protein
MKDKDPGKRSTRTVLNLSLDRNILSLNGNGQERKEYNYKSPFHINIIF